MYTGSVEVPVGRPVTAWITQGTGTCEDHNGALPGEPFTVIKHFGTKTFSEDATFRASVSFPGNGGGSGNAGSNSSSGTGTSSGGIPSGVLSLPNTGGSMALTRLGADS